MKKAIIVLAAVALVGGAYADIFASFSAGFGISGNGSAGGIVDAVDGTTVVLQLIDGGGDGLQSGAVYNPATAGFVLVGNDILLNTIVVGVTASGADFSDWGGSLAGVLQSTYSSDAYIRVSGVQSGDWVWQSSLLALDDKIMADNPPPQTYQFDYVGGSLTGAYEGDTADGSLAVTVIPEPATLGLMGIAGLGMFLARKKARR